MTQNTSGVITAVATMSWSARILRASPQDQARATSELMRDRDELVLLPRAGLEGGLIELAGRLANFLPGAPSPAQQGDPRFDSPWSASEGAPADPSDLAVTGLPAGASLIVAVALIAVGGAALRGRAARPHRSAGRRQERVAVVSRRATRARRASPQPPRTGDGDPEQTVLDG